MNDLLLINKILKLSSRIYQLTDLESYSTLHPSMSRSFSIDSHGAIAAAVATDFRRLRSYQQKPSPCASTPSPPSGSSSTSGAGELTAVDNRGRRRWPAGGWGGGKRWRTSCNGCSLGVSWTGLPVRRQKKTKGPLLSSHNWSISKVHKRSGISISIYLHERPKGSIFVGGSRCGWVLMEVDEAVSRCDDRRLKTKYRNAIYVIQRAFALYP